MLCSSNDSTTILQDQVIPEADGSQRAAVAQPTLQKVSEDMIELQKAFLKPEEWKTTVEDAVQGNTLMHLTLCKTMAESSVAEAVKQQQGIKTSLAAIIASECGTFWEGYRTSG